jgi:hypothetical protein
MHTLDRVFRGLEAGGDPHHQEPASLKNMRKGDATWATRNVILGWTIDTLAMTIELPAYCIQYLFKIFDSVAPHQKRVSVTKW